MEATNSLEVIKDANAKAIAMVERALDVALRQRDGKITPSTETDIQKALFLLRDGGGTAEVLAKVERISTLVFTMSQAQRTGRPNLYASKMLRLKRLTVA